MKKLVQFLLLTLLFFSCNKEQRCDSCQEFLANHKPFKYEKQRYSYARGIAFPGNSPSQWYDDLHDREEELAIMEVGYYRNIEDSLFCFTNMHYEEVMKHFPPNADSIRGNNIDGKTYLMECTVRVGDWDLMRRGEKYIPFLGEPTLKLLFKNENRELIYIGGVASRENYESCLHKE